MLRAPTWSLPSYHWCRLAKDDRLASYVAMRAVAEVERPERTTMAFLVDNEEVGNRNNTGAQSDHFADLLSRLLYAELGTDYREPVLRSALRQTRFISAG